MKRVAILLVSLLFGSACSQPNSASVARGENVSSLGNAFPSNPQKWKVTTPWSDTTVKLVIAGTTQPPIKNSESVDAPARAATYSVPANGPAGSMRPFFISAFADPHTKRISIARGAWPGLKNIFYVSNSSGVVAYEVGPGVLICEGSHVSIAEGAGGLDAAIAQFETQFDGTKLDKIMINSALNNRIVLKDATPLYFFSDGPGPGGGLPSPVIDSVGVTDDILHLVVHNPITMGTATFWIDLKAKKVTRSVVDGQEMDLTTGQGFAVPLNRTNQTFIQSAVKTISAQVPELDLREFDAGKSSSSEVFSGEEYATGEFCLTQRGTLDPRELARQRIPYIDLKISIHHYVSSGDAQLDLEKSLHQRPAMTPPKENYEGGALYKYESGQNMIYQTGLYVIEITPYTDGARPLIMKVLDATLARLNSSSAKST